MNDQYVGFAHEAVRERDEALAEIRRLKEQVDAQNEELVQLCSALLDTRRQLAKECEYRRNLLAERAIGWKK